MERGNFRAGSGYENNQAESGAGCDDTVLVFSTACEGGKHGCRNDQRQHPQVEVLVRPKGNADDWHGDQQEWRDKAVYTADDSHQYSCSIEPNSVLRSAKCGVCL